MISMMYRDRPVFFVKDPQKMTFCHYKLNADIFHGDNLSYCYYSIAGKERSDKKACHFKFLLYKICKGKS